MSFLAAGEVKILSRIVRVGQAGSRVDNASSGGLTCGITEKGVLKKYAYNQNCKIREVNPDCLIRFDYL